MSRPHVGVTLTPKGPRIRLAVTIFGMRIALPILIPSKKK